MQHAIAGALIYLLLILSTSGCGMYRFALSKPTGQERVASAAAQEITNEETIRMMKESVRLKPGDKNATWNLAAEYWSAGNIQQAADRMKMYVKLDPESAEAHNIIGVDYYCRDIYDAALMEFQTAAKLNPDEKQYSYNEALALIKLDRYDEAEQAFDRASGYEEGEFLRRVYAEMISANKAKKLYNDGCTAMENLDTGQAVKCFKAALDIKPNMTEAHVNLGVCYGMMGDNKNRIRHLEQAARLGPETSSLRYNLGLAYYDAGMYSQAIAEFKRVIVLKPSFQDAHFKLGMSLCNTKNYADAAKEFKKCLELYPDWFEAHVDLGTCYLKTGDTDSAIYQFKEAVRLRPSLAEAHYNLGAAYMNAGMLDQASASFQKALKIDPGHRQARIGLREIEVYQGK